MSLAQGNNTPTRPRIEPGSPDSESDALTTRPVRSPYFCVKEEHKNDQRQCSKQTMKNWKVDIKIQELQKIFHIMNTFTAKRWLCRQWISGYENAKHYVNVSVLTKFSLLP